jgi:DNA-binding LytR/AlgR family response regulator
MSKLKVLIVDDEYLALNILTSFIEKISDLELVDKTKNPFEALQILSSNQIDILFLDIQMPTLSGINLLKSLKNPPIVIFTTAYQDYAIDAFNLNAVDYLLKPFSFERFLQAINKAKELYNKVNSNPESVLELNSQDFIIIKSEGKTIKVFYEDILFIEGMKEYIRFRCQDASYMVFERMKNIEALLPKSFIRTHKSFIVSKDKVVACIGNQLEIGSYKIPISREKKEAVLALIFKE